MKQTQTGFLFSFLHLPPETLSVDGVRAEVCELVLSVLATNVDWTQD